MCGIVGLIDNVNGSVSKRLLEEMNNTMFSRGPDGDGYFVQGNVGMAMRRLSIIDINQGWQPFFSRDGQVVSFQNGEIYNYQKLRNELVQAGFSFKSSSDTEVLAHGYSFWGIEGLLSRVDGMYAITILDQSNNTLYLARDRFGEKPLFYTNKPGRFAYASNLLTLTALPWVEDDLDETALDRYLALHYVPGNKTIFREVHRVLPGEFLTVSIDNPVPTAKQYYHLPIGKVRHVTDRKLIALVEEAVSSRLVADVPVGVFLSGGLDSSIVAAVAAKNKPAIATFSMGFGSQSHDESIYAAKVAEYIGSSHHHFLFDETSFIELLPKVAASLDEPVGDQALLPLYWLCREARKYVTVVLAGEGADEVFAGYGYYRPFTGNPGWKARIKELFGLVTAQASDLRTLTSNPTPVTPSGFPLLADAGDRNRLMGKAVSPVTDWEEELVKRLSQTQISLQRATAADILTWLPDDLLVKFDRMAMAQSLEGRAPYLYPGLVEAGLCLSSAERMSGTTSKRALRRIAKNWLPAEILERPKQGFVLPMRKWLVSWFNHYESVNEYFRQRVIPHLEMNVVSQTVAEDIAKGVQRERLLFALLMLAEWFNSHSEKRKALREKYLNVI